MPMAKHLLNSLHIKILQGSLVMYAALMSSGLGAELELILFRASEISSLVKGSLRKLESVSVLLCVYPDCSCMDLLLQLSSCWK